MTLRVGGVDGARGRWLLATCIDQTTSLSLLDTFADVVAVAAKERLDTVGVDMPIGLPSSGSRSADIEARSRLGPRRSSLFPTPVEAVLDATDYRDACDRSRAACGKAISKQVWNLVPAIRQVRDAIAGVDAGRFVEVHPESSFVTLAGVPMPSKKTDEGRDGRIDVLRAVVPDLDRLLAERPTGAAIDDVLDALVITWSAARRVSGTAEVLGEGVDRQGFPLTLTI